MHSAVLLERSGGAAGKVDQPAQERAADEFVTLLGDAMHPMSPFKGQATTPPAPPSPTPTPAEERPIQRKAVKGGESRRKAVP